MNAHRVVWAAPLTLLLLGVPGSIGVDGCAAQTQQPSRNLHDLAKQNGGRYVLPFDADRSVRYPNVTELAKRSQAIIIGRVEAIREHITTDETFITTDAAVRVQEVVKGNLGAGPYVVVSLPGGSCRFSDGMTALVYPRNYRRVEKGKTYLFFLDGKSPVSIGYELAGGIQGQFQLDFGTGTVVPGDVATIDPVVSRHKDKPISNLLVELHRGLRSGK